VTLENGVVQSQSHLIFVTIAKVIALLSAKLTNAQTTSDW
jgi:hypothetical protein